jgi:hypothetical protein
MGVPVRQVDGFTRSRCVVAEEVGLFQRND